MALLPKPVDCYGCAIYGSGQGFSRPEGLGTVGVLILLEALGEHEELEGLPARPYAQTGAILERCIRRASTQELPLDRQMFKLWNTVACRPPDNKLEHTGYEMPAIEHCAVHRNRVIQDFINQHKQNPNVKQPVILAAGNIPFRTLTSIAGTRKSVTYMRGYPFKSPFGLVIPTFHYAYIARTRKLIGVGVHDLYKAVQIAKNGFTELPRYYKPHPTTAEKRDFRDFALASANAHRLICFDIETTNIVKGHGKNGNWPDLRSVQLSMGPGTGMYFDGLDLEPVKQILAGSNPKAGHNVWRFDCRILQEKYKWVINGRVDDTLWMFHHWEPDLTIEASKDDTAGAGSLSTRAGLQFAASFFGMDFAWKHMNDSDPEFYGIADVDACQRIMSKLPGFMKAVNIWHGYDRLVVGNEPILRDMMSRGLPMDNESRLELHDTLVKQSAEIDVDLQSAYPDHLRNVEPKVGLANEPNYKKGNYRKVYLT